MAEDPTTADDATVTGTHVWLVLMKAFRTLERQAARSIQDTGMCFTDFTVLEVLLHKGPLPVNTIGAKVELTSGSATSAIDRLAARGFVRRGEDPSDRRTRLVHLTDKGRDLIQPVFVHHEACMEKAAAELTQDDRAMLVRLLKKLGKSAAESESRSDDF